MNNPPENLPKKLSVMDEITFSSSRERAKEWLERDERDRIARDEQRRADRPAGKLTRGLHEKLSSCNIAQLKTAKEVCNQLIARQRKPPNPIECPSRFVEQVLASYGFKNELFRAELRRTTQRADKVYVNGPYVYGYSWDGSYIKPKYYGTIKRPSKRLSRKVWNILRARISLPEVEKLRAELNEKWLSKTAEMQDSE